MADSPSAQSDDILPKEKDKSSDIMSYQLPIPEKKLETVSDRADPPEQEDEFFTSFKLALILISITVVYFLMMLDMSILATVSQ